MVPANPKATCHDLASVEEPWDAIVALTSIIESSSDAVFTSDPAGAILTWNRSAERLWGWGSAEVLGRPVWVLFPPDVEQQTRLLQTRVMAGETVEDMETEAQRRDGMLVPVCLSVSPTRDGRGRIRGAASIVRDVSEQKLAQATLAEGEARLQETQTLAHVGNWLWDAATNTVQWSDELHRIAGLLPREFDGTYEGHLAGIVPEDQERVDRALTAALRVGRSMREEYRITRPTGEVRWVSSGAEATRDGAGRRVGVRGICKDVTEAKRAEEALRRHASLLHLVQRIAVAANEAETLEEAVSSCLVEVCGHTGWPVGRVSFGGSSGCSSTSDLWHVNDPARSDWLRHQLEERSPGLGALVWTSGEPTWLADPASGVMGFAFPVLVGREVIAVLEFFAPEAAPPDEHLMEAMAAGGIQLGRVSERTRAAAALSHQALHDPLTNLPNRVLFVNRLNHALSRTKRDPGQLAVLFLDLDGFKVVNDSLGHDAGDALLVAVADRLRAALRPGDTIARLGGDEFTVLCEGLRGADEALAIAERLAGALTEPVQLGLGGEVVISTSIGVAFSSGPGDSADRLVRDADVAMYRAKELGPARCEIFDVAMHARASYRLEIVKDLRRAREGAQLVLAYQPQVSLTEGSIVGLEALLRWQHPVRGLLPPAQFIPLAEESQLIVPIGTWVLEEACRQLAEWPEGPAATPLTMSVNVSARQLAYGDLAGVITRILADTQVDPARLCLEITESVLMEDAGFFLDVLLRLKEIGVSLAVDDFGVGYSSLAYLKRFPVDLLKLDQAFIEGLGQGDSQSSAIVQAVVELSRALGLTSVAEGVETAEQAQDLVALGCDVAQGYWFARPQPPEAIAELFGFGKVPLP